MEGEAVSAYVAALKKLAADCNFGTLPTTMVAAEHPVASPPANPTMLPLDIMLHDRFVLGLRDDFLQQRLFAETDLTFAKAYDIAIRAESAGKQQRDLRKPTEPASSQISTSNPTRQVAKNHLKLSAAGATTSSTVRSHASFKAKRAIFARNEVTLTSHA